MVGVINIILQKFVLDEYLVFLFLGVGNYGILEILVVVNFFIVDNWVVCVVGVIFFNDGYNDDGMVFIDDVVFCVQVFGEVLDDLIVCVSVDYFMI